MLSLAQGYPGNSEDDRGVSLIKWCAHDGDVSAIRFLLGNGANPNCVTNPSAETGAFIRNVRTKAETPLHRAATFATEEANQLLLDAGAKRDAKATCGDSPLSWRSSFEDGMGWGLLEASLLGTPHV